jgi:hypothetical protein
MTPDIERDTRPGLPLGLEEMASMTEGWQIDGGYVERRAKACKTIH